MDTSHAMQVFKKENKETIANNLVKKTLVLLNWLGFVIQLISIKKMYVQGVVIVVHQKKAFVCPIKPNICNKSFWY